MWDGAAAAAAAQGEDKGIRDYSVEGASLEKLTKNERRRVNSSNRERPAKTEKSQHQTRSPQ